MNSDVTESKPPKAPFAARVAEGAFLAAGLYTLVTLIAAFVLSVAMPLNKTVAVVGIAAAYLATRIAGDIRPAWPAAAITATSVLTLYFALIMIDGAGRLGVRDLVSGLATSATTVVSALMGS